MLFLVLKGVFEHAPMMKRRSQRMLVYGEKAAHDSSFPLPPNPPPAKRPTPDYAAQGRATDQSIVVQIVMTPALMCES